MRSIKFIVIYYIFFFIFIIFVFCCYKKQTNVIVINNSNLNTDNYKEKTNNDSVNFEKVEEPSDAFQKYNNCLFDNNFIPNIKELQDALNNYVIQYPVAVYYEELNSDYKYVYNENKTFYGASLIKIVDALYLFDNNINLDNEILLSEKAKSISSKCLENYSANNNIALRALLFCALNVSDNGAHYDLIHYIGVNNLKNYAKNNLGVKLTINDNDLFGLQTANNTNIYLKRLYYLFNNSNQGDYMKKSMIDNNTNYLNLKNNVDIFHKYGYYGSYYHDIGLVYDNYPYTISVLTELGNGDYQDIVNNISEKVYAIHDEFWKQKENYCNKLIYE